MKRLNSRFFVRYIFSFMLVFQPITGICQNSTEVIQVKFRKVSEIVEFVKMMVSEDGNISIDNRTNTIVVTDDQERIGKIKSLIKRLDVLPKQIRVRVRFQEENIVNDRSIAAEGTVSGDNVKITTRNRKKDGIDIRVSDRNISKNKQSEYFINVLSGSPAYIITGENVIYRERWNYLLEKYAGTNERLNIQRIETGFDVKPTVTGDTVDIEIIPRISYRDPGRRQKIIRFTEASTTISAHLNQWVTIGGAQKEDSEVIREILEYATSANSSSLSISLMVEQ